MSRLAPFFKSLVEDPCYAEYKKKTALQHMESGYQAWVERKAGEEIRRALSSNSFRAAQREFLFALNALFQLAVWPIRVAVTWVLSLVFIAGKADKAIANMGNLGKLILSPIRLLTFLPGLVSYKRLADIENAALLYTVRIADLATNLLVLAVNPLFMLLDWLALPVSMVVSPGGLGDSDGVSDKFIRRLVVPLIALDVLLFQPRFSGLKFWELNVRARPSTVSYNVQEILRHSVYFLGNTLIGIVFLAVVPIHLLESLAVRLSSLFRKGQNGPSECASKDQPADRPELSKQDQQNLNSGPVQTLQYDSSNPGVELENIQPEDSTKKVSPLLSV